MFNFLALLFLWFRITYQFWDLLYTKVHCIMPTLNLWQNPSFSCCLLHLSLLDSSWSSFFALTCNLLPDVLFCCICNISSSFCPSWTFCIPLLSICIYCNWNTLVSHLYWSCLKTSQYLWVLFFLQMLFLFLFYSYINFLWIYISIPLK